MRFMAAHSSRLAAVSGSAAHVPSRRSAALCAAAAAAWSAWSSLNDRLVTCACGPAPPTESGRESGSGATSTRHVSNRYASSAPTLSTNARRWYLCPPAAGSAPGGGGGGGSSAAPPGRGTSAGST